MAKIDIAEEITDEQLEGIGMTREHFRDSPARHLLDAMLMAFDKTVQETTLKLMKEKSLSYGEAYSLAVEMTRKSAEEMMRG